MNWMPVEKEGRVTGKVYLVCGRNYRDDRVMDFATWHVGWGWDLAINSFEPQFYAVLEWPPELVDDGEGL